MLQGVVQNKQSVFSGGAVLCGVVQPDGYRENLPLSALLSAVIAGWCGWERSLMMTVSLDSILLSITITTASSLESSSLNHVAKSVWVLLSTRTVFVSSENFCI